MRQSNKEEGDTKKESALEICWGPSQSFLSIDLGKSERKLFEVKERTTDRQ